MKSDRNENTTVFQKKKNPLKFAARLRVLHSPFVYLLFSGGLFLSSLPFAARELNCGTCFARRQKKNRTNVCELDPRVFCFFLETNAKIKRNSLLVAKQKVT